MKSLFADLKENSLLASILLMCVLLPRHFHLSIACLAVCFYGLRTHGKSTLLFAMAVMLSILPHRMKIPEKEGIVITRSARYVTVLSDGAEGIVYFQSEPPILDSVIELDGEWEEISASSGFYKYDFADACRRRNRYYSMSCTPVEIQRSFSLRGMLQERIQSMEDRETALLLDRVIFGIRNEETPLQSSLMNSGFSQAGILIFLSWLLSYFLTDKMKEKVLLFVNLFLCLFYHFPYLLTQRLIFRILKHPDLSYRQRCGIGWMIGLILYPHVITSASFILPTVYRMCMLFEGKKKLPAFFFGSMAQTILFHQWSPIMSLLYSGMVGLQGLAVLSAIPACFLHTPLFLVHVCDRIASFIDHFTIQGSMLGTGAVFFVLLCASCCRKKNRYIYYLVWFVLFQCTGLFHPFAELSFLNVGQGDAIVLRAPLGRDNVLVDTGKPGQYRNLRSFLDAKGIRKLDTFFITHADDDHSGSRDSIILDYAPDHVREAHSDVDDSRLLDFVDLNTITNEDENESCLVLLTSIGNRNILLMGDADEKTEKQIIRTYGDLPVNILKLSHHGSKTGSCEEFLDAVKPEISIISSGAYQIYHHPSPEVIQRLLARHIPYLDTKEEGDITFLFLGRFCILFTSSHRFALL